MYTCRRRGMMTKLKPRTRDSQPNCADRGHDLPRRRSGIDQPPIPDNIAGALTIYTAKTTASLSQRNSTCNRCYRTPQTCAAMTMSNSSAAIFLEDAKAGQTPANNASPHTAPKPMAPADFDSTVKSVSEQTEDIRMKLTIPGMQKF